MSKDKFEAILLDKYNEGYGDPLKCHRLSILLPDEQTRKAVIDTLQSAYDLGANESKWVSLDDRLPDDNKWKTCYHAGNGYLQAKYDKQQGLWVEYNKGLLPDKIVTHYQDMPAPPHLPAQSDTEPVEPDERWCIYLDNNGAITATYVIDFIDKVCPEIKIIPNHYFGILNGEYRLMKTRFAPLITFEEFLTIKNKTV